MVTGKRGSNILTVFGKATGALHQYRHWKHLRSPTQLIGRKYKIQWSGFNIFLERPPRFTSLATVVPPSSFLFDAHGDRCTCLVIVVCNIKVWAVFRSSVYSFIHWEYPRKEWEVRLLGFTVPSPDLQALQEFELQYKKSRYGSGLKENGRQRLTFIEYSSAIVEPY